MKEIILNAVRKTKKYCKYKALVDDEDFERVSKYNWSVCKCGNIIYAITAFHDNGKRTTLLMHKLITGYKETDHIDGNGLNNQRGNLRSVTDSQNQMNRKNIRGTSKYKGVYWNKANKKWLARITINQKNIYIGYFLYEHNAAHAYNFKATELYGEYASLNPIAI